jgi:DNA-directed RNA polymerase subunit RPC12/RpoP
MAEVNYCPICGTKTDDSIEAFRPYIDCEECDQKVYMEVWTYD